MKKPEEKSNANLFLALGAVLVLILGGVIGAVAFSTHTEISENYCDTSIQAALDNVVCEPITETIEVPIEVIAPSVLDLAVQEFILAVEDEEDEAGNDLYVLENASYDFDEMTVKEVSEDYNVSYGKDTTVVEFSIELKFKDSHNSTRNDYNVIVSYENDEDTEVIATLIE